MSRDRCFARDERPDAAAGTQRRTRMAAFEPAPFLVSDPEYLAAMGGAKQDASVMTGLSQWLEDTIISIPEIEAFKEELATKGMR